MRLLFIRRKPSEYKLYWRQTPAISVKGQQAIVRGARFPAIRTQYNLHLRLAR